LRGRCTRIAAVRLGGAIAGAVIKGAMDGDVFIAWVREALLAGLRPGDIVVMDNLPAHKRAAARTLIEAAGCELWLLPSYSPDMNPIEMMWSKVKQLIRSAEPRSYEALTQAVFAAMDAVTADDAAGFFSHCGYNPPLI
jgi:transposase